MCVFVCVSMCVCVLNAHISRTQTRRELDHFDGRTQADADQQDAGADTATIFYFYFYFYFSKKMHVKPQKTTDITSPLHNDDHQDSLHHNHTSMTTHTTEITSTNTDMTVTTTEITTTDTDKTTTNPNRQALSLCNVLVFTTIRSSSCCCSSSSSSSHANHLRRQKMHYTTLLDVAKSVLVVV